MRNDTGSRPTPKTDVLICKLEIGRHLFLYLYLFRRLLFSNGQLEVMGEQRPRADRAVLTRS